MDHTDKDVEFWTKKSQTTIPLIAVGAGVNDTCE